MGRVTTIERCHWQETAAAELYSSIHNRSLFNFIYLATATRSCSRVIDSHPVDDIDQSGGGGGLGRNVMGCLRSRRGAEQ